MSGSNSSANSDADLELRRARIRRGLRRANTAAVVVLILVIGLSSGAVFQAFRAERSAREAGRSRRAAEQESQGARHAQAQALFEQARSRRRTGEAGQRFETLATLASAAALQPSRTVRDEAIAALALPDARFVPVWTNSVAVYWQFSPSLREFALPEPEGAIQLRNSEDARVKYVLPSAGAEVDQLWFSPDERFLAVRYANGSNLVWDLAVKSPVLKCGADSRFIEFCPNSENVLIQQGSNALRCLRLADSYELWQCQPRGEVVEISIASQRPCFALAVNDGPLVQIRSLTTGELLRELASNCPLGTLAWSPDGNQLVIGRENGGLEVWDAQTWTRTLSWRAHDDSVVEARFDPLGRWLATASWDRTIRFWNLPDFRQVMAATGFEAHFLARFSPDGGRFACERDGRTWGYLEVTSSPVLRRVFVPAGDARGSWSMDISPDGTLVAAGYTDGLRLLELATGRQLAFEAFADCRSALFTPDGLGVVTCGISGLIYRPLARGSAGETLGLGPTQSLREGRLAYASLTPDGQRLATVNRANACVEILDLRNPTNTFALTPHPHIQHVAISPNGQWVASGTWRGRGVKVWEVATRRQVAELGVDESAAVAFSPDSRLLVTSAREYRVWECGAWRELYRTPEIGAVVPPCAFSPDGQLMALLKDSYTIELRKPATGEVLALLQPPASPIVSVLRFTPDSTKLLALEWTRQIEVWDLARMHQELSKVGLDWNAPDRTIDPKQLSSVAETPPTVVQAADWPDHRASGAGTAPGQLGSRTGPWFYIFTLGALALGIGIGLYTLRYHQRMMHSYEEVEAVATERNLALDLAQTELLHSQKMRALGTLAAGVAHDFNNLLSIIRMGNNLLGRRQVSAAEKAESSLAVERAVEQGKKIVRSMLGYSREHSDEAECYSVPDVVNEAGLLLNQQFLRGITVTLELDRDLPAVTGRRGKLLQILLNLIVNAAEAMNGQGRLRIVARATGSLGPKLVLQPRQAARYIELVIEDTGPGIDPQIRDRIFEPFFSTKPRGASSGTGLGLSLVHSLAEQETLGLSLQSEPGQGTTFTIWIPIAEIPAETSADHQTQTAPDPEFSGAQVECAADAHCPGAILHTN